ncbi:glutamate ligase domain-containing protein, partial [Klebsiella pneumoniae]|uniref:glutamate ligase domain-containing protein n=3 Tax=Gammaproteobacteria TaxID=1236 RepID=UPI00390C9598
KAEASPGRTLAVYAALQDKDAVGVVQALQEVVGDWTLAGLDGARGQSAGELQARLAATAAATAALAGTVEQALAQVLARAERGDRVLVFGSFHTAAAALQWLQAHA